MDYRVSFKEFLRLYRKKHNLTQRELAAQCGVSDITISRAEDINSLLAVSPKVINGMAALVTGEELKWVSTSDSYFPELSKAFLKLHEEKYKSSLPSDAPIYVRIIDYLNKRLAELGYSPTQGTIQSNREEYYNKKNNKIWQFVITDPSDNDSLESITNTLYIELGKSLFGINPNKFTLVSSSPLSYDLISTLKKLPSNGASFDVSFITYIPESDSAIEYDIALFGNGRGIFDLDSKYPKDVAEANKDYVKWKRSLLP